MTYGPTFTGINLDGVARLNGISKYALGEIAAANLFLQAYQEDDFPVPIFKQSLTLGPMFY